MTADPRVTAARAFLAEAKQRKFADKPNSVLVREAAELRHQLSQVLKAIDAADETPRPRPRLDGSVGEASFVARDGSGILTPADVLNVLSALADAAVYRSTHADARDLADVAAYRRLSRALGDDS
jgi:vacuolar-type H+-ATPase subunit B/Vma2